MRESEEICRLLSDREIAVEFYQALCNVDWEKVFVGTEEDRVFDKLRGADYRIWHCSWRYAGGLIADIRNWKYNLNEDYMDFYCSGNESEITDRVRHCFERIGWKEDKNV
jgi:hypothetical protein